MVGVRDSNLAADLGGEGAGVGVGEVALAVEDRGPLGRDRVLEVGHVDLRTGVEAFDEGRSQTRPTSSVRRSTRSRGRRCATRWTGCRRSRRRTSGVRHHGGEQWRLGAG